MGQAGAQIIFSLNFLAEFFVGFIEKTVKEGTKKYNSIVGVMPKEGLGGPAWCPIIFLLIC